MTAEPAAGAAPSAPAPRFAALILCAAALAAMLPELLTGLSLSDSFRYNLVWTEQFVGLVRDGHLYPRWLPHSWDGFGSPTFYFYPPLYFWVAAIVDTLTLRLLPAGALISLASAVMLAVSGLAMRAWLRLHVAPRPAFFGALAYMAAPYHLYDIYVRGALAESCAYAFLPLIALALRRLAEGMHGHGLLLAGAYAGLILSHLPSALLATLFLVAPYTIFCIRYARSPVRFLAAAGAAGAAGIALTALYLLPAVMLAPHISLDAFVGPYFRPDTWFFWRPSAWPQPEAMWLIIPLAFAALLLVMGADHVRRGQGERPEALLWSGITAASVVMISGLLPFLWDLPLLAQVQFPWRLYVIVEFAAITVLAASMPLRWNAPIWTATVLLYLCLGFTGLLVTARINAFAGRGAAEAASVRQDYREAPEYLPRGLYVPPGLSGAPDPTRLVLAPGPEAAADLPAARVQAERAPDGGLRVEVDSPAPVTVAARRFYFPHWCVTDAAGRAVAAGPSDNDRLLSWRAPAGRSTFTVRTGAAPFERTGLLVSGAALLALLVPGLWFGIGGRVRPMHAKTD